MKNVVVAGRGVIPGPPGSPALHTSRQPDGTLVYDVVIGDYRRPWNARSDAGRLAPGIPKESLWAYQAGGLEQVGFVYTAQGFEFDYVGVIFGPDLVFDPKGNCWRGVPERSSDAG